ncbi:hypothetical protein [Brassicibacter mesophilus]|uniref:hypothetical protein n=1 Tax=Brassicibacter mesophilus TaxID=745119 RepID=UPI003D19BE0F
MDKTVYIDNESNYYKTKVIGKGVFLFKNINPGKYNISLLDEKGDVLFKKEVEVSEKGLTHTKIHLNSNNNPDDISK